MPVSMLKFYVSRFAFLKLWFSGFGLDFFTDVFFPQYHKALKAKYLFTLGCKPFLRVKSPLIDTAQLNDAVSNFQGNHKRENMR